MCTPTRPASWRSPPGADPGPELLKEGRRWCRGSRGWALAPGSRELAEECARALGRAPAVVMARHGVIAAARRLRRRCSAWRCWSCSPASLSAPRRTVCERHAAVRAGGGFAPGTPLAERMRPRSLDEVVGQATLVGRRRGAAPARRARRAAVPHALGTARVRQDDRRAAAGGRLRRRAGEVLGRALGGEGGAGGDGGGAAPARRHRPSHRALRRRGAPLQQGAAGRLPALRRERRHRAHRRHDREPLLRAQRRAAVAGQGVRPRAAGRGRPRRLLSRAPWTMPSAGSAARALECGEEALQAIVRPRRRRRPGGATTCSRWPPRRCRAGRRRRPRAGAQGRAAAAGTLRQGGRGALQPHLGPPQVDPQLGRGRRRCTGWPACSRAVPTRVSSPGGSCGWRRRTSAWPTRARSSRWPRRPTPSSTWGCPSATSRSPRRWSTWRSPPSPTPCTSPTGERAPWRTGRPTRCRCTCATRRRGS